MSVGTNIEGIVANPFRVIQATTKMGPDATIIEEPRASNGVVAQVFGPNQIIMDTGYFEENLFIGVHHFDIRWFSDTSGNGLSIEYWKRDKNGIETQSITPRSIPIALGNSDGYGSSAGGGYFNENFEYRFIIKSHADVSATQYVSVDWLKITIQDHWGVAGHGQAGNSEGIPLNLMITSEVQSVNGLGTAGVYSYSTTVTTTYDATQAYIIANTTNANFFCSITGATTTSYTITFTHRNDTAWSGLVYAYVVAYLVPYYDSI
jgi:hypothetical protein